VVEQAKLSDEARREEDLRQSDHAVVDEPGPLIALPERGAGKLSAPWSTAFRRDNIREPEPVVEESGPLLEPPLGSVGAPVALLAIQRTAGNYAVNRMIARAKLAGGGTPDEHGNEVDVGARVILRSVGSTFDSRPERLSQRAGDNGVLLRQSAPALDHPTPDQLALSGGNKWKPDPTDPYEQAPINFGGFPGTVQDGPPPAFTKAAFLDPPPKPYVNQFGDRWDYGMPPGSVMPQQTAKANRANAAFHTTYDELAVSCAETYPKVTSFVDVSKQLQGDLHFKLAFGDVPGAKDLGDVVLGQKTPDGTSVEDLFKSKKGSVGATAQADTSKGAMAKANEPANKALLEDARRKVTLKNSQAQSAARRYATAMEHSDQAAVEVAIATRAVEIRKRKEEEKGLAEEEEKLKQKKERYAENIENGSKAFKIASKVIFAAIEAEHSPATAAELGIEAGNELITMIIKSVATASLDDQIKDLDAKIQEIDFQVNEDEGELVDDELKIKKQEFATAKNAIPTEKTTMMDALGDAQSAYNDFAKLAGSLAGGSAENRKRVEAAIMAIPKVELVLGKIAEVRPSMKIPPYSEDAGIGLNANLPTVGENFRTNYSVLKGYQGKFTKDEQLWLDRLKSLKAVAAAFAPEPPGKE
jgi:hypothetical protein